ncbi:MAG: ABC transporter ATP-binding protein [Myxococcales bacterium]
METAIRLQGLTHRYGDVTAVDGVDLEVRAGECFGLLGPNGAGKTTTLEILEGLLEPTAGRVEILGLDWRHRAPELRRRIGVALQETRLNDRLTVEETLRLFRSFYESGPTVAELLSSMQLQDKRATWVMRLSGGQRQRLAVACGLAGDPDVLFLDEPTTGLDPQSRRAVWDIVLAYRARGRTVILTTHYMDEAERLCDRVAVIDQGKVIALGTPRELIGSLGAEILVHLATDPMLPPEAFDGTASVRAQRREGASLAFAVDEPHVAVPALLERVAAGKARLTELSTRSATLEDVFVSLTGRSLRDG